MPVSQKYFFWYKGHKLPNYKTHIQTMKLTSIEGMKGAGESRMTQFLQNALKCFQELGSDYLFTPHGHR